MASNLSTIGFVFENVDAFRAAMLACANGIGLRAPCPNGSYGIWKSRTGAEVWFHLSQSHDGNTEIYGLTPYFEGNSDAKVRIIAAISQDGDNDFEGAFHAWVNPNDADSGSYPIVFEAVDFATQAGAEWPAIRVVRLVAFAKDVQAFESEAAYAIHQNANSGDTKFRMASKSLIATGLFAAAMSSENPDSREPPSADALLSGVVIEHRMLTNEATGRDFAWLLLETLDFNLEVIADPEIVNGAIVDGGVVEVTATLFGRFID